MAPHGGLKLDYEAIEVLSRDMLGRDGLVSVYAGPDQAAAMWTEMQDLIQKGGNGLYTLPHTPLKCAGAPLKMGFLTESHARNAKRREALNLTFNSSINKLFSDRPILSAGRPGQSELGLVGAGPLCDQAAVCLDAQGTRPGLGHPR